MRVVNPKKDNYYNNYKVKDDTLDIQKWCMENKSSSLVKNSVVQEKLSIIITFLT